MLWVERWMTIHSIIILSSCSIFLFTKNITIIGISAVISFAALFIWKAKHSTQVSFLVEPANLVTLFRFLALLFILFSLNDLSDFWIGTIALIVLILDGLDGYLARRFKNTSPFGAYFDMETDAFLVLTLCSILWFQEKIGSWILLVAWLRYIYFLLLLFFKPSKQKESRDYFAQVIAVILMSSLISGFLLPAKIYIPAIFIGSCLVFYSFGNSFLGVLRRR